MSMNSTKDNVLHIFKFLCLSGTPIYNIRKHLHAFFVNRTIFANIDKPLQTLKKYLQTFEKG